MKMNSSIITMIILIFINLRKSEGLSCGSQQFTDFTGKTYHVDSHEICTWSEWGICIISQCEINDDIFSEAIESSGWDWSNPHCSDYNTGSSGTDDMVCSNPVDVGYYNRYFKPVCKIHDMCYKNNARNSEVCDSEFHDNLEAMCHIAFPDIVTAVQLADCLLVAVSWYGAVTAGGTHRGGINPNTCNPGGYRNDYIETLTVTYEGPWGNWGNTVYCDDNQFVKGFWWNVEPDQGGGDDTGANSMTMVCSDGAEILTNNWDDAIYGSWEYMECPTGTYITGYDIQYANSDSSDDKSIINMEAYCSDNTGIYSQTASDQATLIDSSPVWTPKVSCPSGSLVCGYSQKIEPDQGGGDDTSLNAVRLQCCTITDDELYCNRPPIQGDIGGYEYKRFIFTNNEIPMSVTFTNCESDFDPQLRLYYESYYQLNWPDGCDDDDCASTTYPCSNNLRETPTVHTLETGAYILEIRPYSAGGTYFLQAYCNIPSSGSISIGSTVSGVISDDPAMIFYDFTITSPTAIPVLFTDCNSDFDPKLYVYNHQFEIISLDVCGGDDCSDSSYPCSQSLRETFTLQLSSGNYYVGITPYNSGGTYSIFIQVLGSQDSLYDDNNRNIVKVKYLQYVILSLVTINIICIAIYCCNKGRKNKIKNVIYKPVEVVSSDTDIN